MDYSAYVVPLLLAFVALFALAKRVNVYEALTRGASQGLSILGSILPALVGLMTAVYMLRASGAMEALGQLLAPVLIRLGIPPETASLLLIRPVSGSGALAVGSELMSAFGPDSYIGRVAAVMLGSSETTFYAVAVYLALPPPPSPCGCSSGNNVKRPEHTLRPLILRSYTPQRFSGYSPRAVMSARAATTPGLSSR